MDRVLSRLIFSPNRCSICTELFANAHKLRLHVVSNHEDLNQYKCETCDKIFSSTKDLERHIQAKVCHKTFRCNNCNKSISTSYALEQHINLGM